MSDQSFDYYVTDGHKLLPIDYSRNELGKKWDVDPRMVNRHIANSCLLESSLSALTQPLAGQYGNKTSFPVEAEFFLKTYFDQVQSMKLSAENVSSDEKRTLYRKLCETLYSEILTPKDGMASTLDPDSSIFYRHALFHSEGFNRYTMNQLWQTHLNLRVNQIRNLAGSISADKQAEALQACLVALDRICLTLMQAAENSPQKPPPPAKRSLEPPKRSLEPRELLDELFAPRKKLSPSASRYRLRNQILTYRGEKGEQTISLEAAFKKLHCTKFPNKELMTQARSAYMHDLAVHTPISNFEKKYTDLSGYMNFFDTELDEKSLTAKIIEEMKPVLATKIYNCCCSPSEANEAIQQENHPLTYFEAFLSDESKAFIQESAEILGDSIELVQTITNLRRRYCALPLEVQYRFQGAFEQAVYRNVIYSHMVWFVRVWAFVNREEPAFDDEQLSGFDEKCIPEIIQFVQDKSIDFSCKGNEAVAYFGKTAESAYKSLRIVNNAGAQNNEIWNLNRVNSDLVLGICLIFQRVVEDLAPKVSRNIKLFQKYQLTYHKRKM